MLKSKIHRATVTACDPAADLDSYAPIVVHVGERNEVAHVDSHPEILLDHEGSNR